MNGDGENRPIARPVRTRKVGLADLLAMTGFIMPIFAAIAAVNRSGGGIVAYLLAVPPGIVLGVLIISFEWKLGKAIWLRFERYSRKVQNAVGFSLFVFQLLWIFLGLVCGSRVGVFVVNHLAR
jgi:hypothetical protein